MTSELTGVLQCGIPLISLIQVLLLAKKTMKNKRRQQAIRLRTVTILLLQERKKKVLEKVHDNVYKAHFFCSPWWTV